MILSVKNPYKLADSPFALQYPLPDGTILYKYRSLTFDWTQLQCYFEGQQPPPAAKMLPGFNTTYTNGQEFANNLYTFTQDAGQF